MRTARDINLLTVDTYAQFVAIDDEYIVLVNADSSANGGTRWQINVPRQYAADLIAELAHGLEGEPS